MTRRDALLAGVAAGLWSTRPAALQRADPSPRYDSYRVVAVYPHDPTAFTQGLLVRGEFFYESTGLEGRSTLRKVRIETGEVVAERRVARPHFAEGLAEINGRLYQLTWQSEIAFVYDLQTLEPLGTVRYRGEGWGLASDGPRLVLSDGSEYLRIVEPGTFRQLGRLRVTDAGAPVRGLNELELVGGEIFANVWHTDRIARISPASGRVLGWIDLTGLTAGYARADPEAVLNGIAYDAASRRLFVTGKLWPRIFWITIVSGR